MITPVIFYEQMKKWVAKDPETKTLRYIYFDGESAYASNRSRMAIVKDYHQDHPHFETTDGQLIKPEAPKTDPAETFRKVLTKENERDWVWERESQSANEDLLNKWKLCFDFVAKLAKSKREMNPICYLRKADDRLECYAISHDGSQRAKLVLLDHIDTCSTQCWQAAFSTKYLIDTVAFLRATSPVKLQMYVRAQKRDLAALTFETDDLILMLMCAYIGKVDSQLRDYADQENKDFLS